MQSIVIQSIKNLLKKENLFIPSKYHIVTTEGLRLSKNSASLIKRIKEETGISTSIAMQEEGVLGFLSAMAVSNIPPSNALVWDIGGGSFQMTTKQDNDYIILKGNPGRLSMKQAILKLEKKLF
jgi:exopolyphosphatase/pppGpp-phosphohydrolase